jgi:Transposase DDE domain
LPRRWVIERTIAWIMRNRRMSRDYEFLSETTEALIYVAMIRVMLRRLAKGVSRGLLRHPLRPFTPRRGGLHLVVVDGYAQRWMLRRV